MRVAAAILSESASAREGLLNLIGGGINILARSHFPAPADCALSVVLEGERADLDHEHEVLLELIDPTGTRTLIAGADLEAQLDAAVREADLPIVVSIVFRLNNVSLGLPGRYELSVTLDGAVSAVYPFRAVVMAHGVVGEASPGIIDAEQPGPSEF